MSQEKEVMVSEEQQEVTEAKFDGAVADGSSLGSVEDLGGPTPTNNKPDDESDDSTSKLGHSRKRSGSESDDDIEKGISRTQAAHY